MAVYNGRSYKQPGAYAFVDSVGMLASNLASGGILAIIGPAEGGTPNEVVAYTDTVLAKSVFKGGDLLTAALDAWSEGANIIYMLRIGSASQASLTLSESTTGVLTLTSDDYGTWANDIQVKVETGSVSGKKVTIKYYDNVQNRTTLETGDNLADATGIASWVNSNSNYVSAEALVGAGVPDNISYTNLAGGLDGDSPTVNQWSAGIDQLAFYQVNLIHLAGCTDASVHALLSAHCDTNSNNRRWRMGIVGNEIGESVGNTTTGIIKRAYDLNSSRMVLVAPGSDGESGASTAAKVAGALAGVDVATPITHRTFGISSLDRKFTDTEKDDLITYGVCAFEESPQGRRVIRGITTVQDISATQEDPMKEISVQRIADYISYNMYVNLEGLFVGKKGLSGTNSSIKSAAISILLKLKDAQIIVDFRNVNVSQDPSDPKVFYVSYEVAPISPINFIFIQTHLVNVLS
jgi:hypothetical protein